MMQRSTNSFSTAVYQQFLRAQVHTSQALQPATASLSRSPVAVVAPALHARPLTQPPPPVLVAPSIDEVRADFEAAKEFERQITRPRFQRYWKQCLNRHVKFHGRRERDELCNKRLTTRADSAMMPLKHQSTQGDKRLEALNYWLNNLGVECSPDQRLFHWHFTNAVLPKVFGPQEWNEASLRVMKERGLERTRSEVLITTPRRWGKTWAVALFVLALMLACPGIRVCVFSTGKRASSSLMEIIMQFINNQPDLNKRIVKQNQEELYISSRALSDGNKQSAEARMLQGSAQTSKLFCYPVSRTLGFATHCSNEIGKSDKYAS